jgi:hypothetical protein
VNKKAAVARLAIMARRLLERMVALVFCGEAARLVL